MEKKRVVNGKIYIFKNGRWVPQNPPADELDPHDPDYSWEWDLENRR